MNINEESKLRTESLRGQRAAELMEDPLMVEAFTILQERFQTEWVNSPARDTEGRERLWLMQKLLTNLKGHIEEIMRTGQMASIQLEQHRTRTQKAKEWLKNLA